MTETAISIETDEALVAHYREGDEAAFNTLVERHLPGVYSFVVRFVGNKEEAEDISQETFLKAWKHIAKYEPNTSKFKTWILRIARNTSIDYLRKKKHIPFSDFTSKDEDGGALFAETIPDAQPLPDELFATAENSELLEAALAPLPSPYREVLLLHYQGGLTFLEIGQALGEPQNTVKSRHHRALKALHKTLQGKTNIL